MRRGGRRTRREHEALLGLAPLGIAVERRDDRAAVATAHGGGDDFLVVGAAQGNCRLPLIEDGKRVERAFDHVEGGRIERTRVVEGQRAELVGARDGVLLLSPAGDVAVDVEVLASHVWDHETLAFAVVAQAPFPGGVERHPARPQIHDGVRISDLGTPALEPFLLALPAVGEGVVSRVRGHLVEALVHHAYPISSTCSSLMPK